MGLMKRISIGVLVGAWTALAFAGGVMAKGNTTDTKSEGWVAKGSWQDRVLQRGPTTHSGPEQAKADQQRVAQRSPSQPTRLRTASTPSQPAQEEAEEIAPGDQQMQVMPLPAEDAYDATGTGAAGMYAPGAADSCVDGGGCYDSCGGPYGGYGPGLYGLRSEWWARDLSLTVGAHGFKGPFDRGRNGNFGLHEGVDFGAPLGGPWGWGYQVGFAAVHSNFSGDQATGGLVRRGDRDQFFFTTGIFHRALSGGIQWGITFDLLRDTYYANADLKQIRTEIGYLFPGGRGEIGYWGAYGVENDEILLGTHTISLEPTDLYAFYYRRRFEGGGEGRLWGGFTGQGDGLLGADFLVPLGRSWALENRLNYLIPNEGRGGAGQDEESWGLSIQLVWYVGQPARQAQNSPYRPVLGVADNSVFMFDYVPR
jgi:hypothetical protein